MIALESTEEAEFICACTEGDIDAVRRVIGKHPEALNAVTSEGLTPLAHAMERAQVEMVAFLLDQGADMNIRDTTQRTPCELAEALGFTPLASLFRAVAEKRDRAEQWAQVVAAVEQYSSGLEAPLTLPRRTLRLLK
ncbi:MAG: ankyrin repeat domain-containing protein [Alphaproteobacteria bacterium]|nr:MAG: ankyrin repeat domain-containing protein [Alphaproteobacteria bacterium]